MLSCFCVVLNGSLVLSCFVSTCLVSGLGRRRTPNQFYQSHLGAVPRVWIQVSVFVLVSVLVLVFVLVSGFALEFLVNTPVACVVSLSCLVLFVLPCLVCLVLSCPLSCLVLSCLVLSLVLSCLVFCLVLSCLVSCLVLSPVLSCLALSCPLLSCLVFCLSQKRCEGHQRSWHKSYP
jgi:hypothetical protein